MSDTGKPELPRPRLQEDELAWRGEARALLEESRGYLLGLLRPLAQDTWHAQPRPLVSPPVWHLLAAAHEEERWCLRALGAPSVASAELDAQLDPQQHPRSARGGLALPSPAKALDYAARVRAAVLERLAALTPEDARRLSGRGARVRTGLLDAGQVYALVAQRELQHAEALAVTLQLTGTPVELGEAPAPARPARPPQVTAEYPGGPTTLGTDAPGSFDNERPAHPATLRPYALDVHPVTNGDYLVFVEAGGYAQARWWHPDARAFVEAEGWEAPLFWRRAADGLWWRTQLGREERLLLDEPVTHVSWFEADAFARWAGRRLPTEAEWEHAARGPGGAGEAAPWGAGPWMPERANLGRTHRGPLAIGALPAGATATGVMGLFGDAWEWTADTFRPWPGTVAFPDRHASEVHYGSAHRVLRGGSWATHPRAVRNSLRHRALPQLRHLFTGFRLAADCG